MLHTAPCPTSTRTASPANLLARIAAGLRRAWAGAHVAPDEPGLAQATDHADLERRLRRLERGRPDRFGPLPR